MRVGDLVVLRDPEDRRRLLIKRVSAMPGDPMPIDLPGEEPPRVPADHVFVLADRRSETRDSRRFGPVPFDLVIGRAWFRYGPPGRRGALSAERAKA